MRPSYYINIDLCSLIDGAVELIVTLGFTDKRAVRVNKQLSNDAFLILLKIKLDIMSSTDAASNQHYNLKWTNHTNNILQMFSEHLQKEQLVDVTLSCEGQFLKAHKMVLSACSPYFQELFKIHAAEHPVIIMNGVRFSTLQQMIDFMYQGEIKVGDVDLDNLLTVAESMQVKGLCKIRREKNAGASDILKMRTDIAQNNTSPSKNGSPKGRKRRKRSRSPLNNSSESSSSESQVNGEHNPTQMKNVEDDKEESDKDAPKPKLSKSAVSTKQQPSSFEVIPEDKTVDKQGTKIPRPPNAFMIFANEWRKKLAVEHQGESNKEISVRLGNMWKSLPGTTKDLYYSAARKADEDHKVKYPGYYYSPKEARLRKEMRGNNSQQKANLVPQSGGIMRDIDTTSLVKLIMPDTRNDGPTEEVNPGEIKDEPGSNDEFENDSNENNDNSSSSEENVASTSDAKN